MFILSIKEEVFGAGSIEEYDIQLSGQRVTLADLIQAKTAKEIELVNLRLRNNDVPGQHAWIKKEERILNERAIKKQEAKEKERITSLIVDEEKACYDALAGFQANAFFVIVDGEQKTDLNDELMLTKNTAVQFVRLTPLVGG